MSFRRIPRGLAEPAKPAPVPFDAIVIDWRNFHLKPVLMIALGRNIASRMGMRSPRERVHLLVGYGDDAGRAAIRYQPWDADERGDYWADWRGDTCRVTVPSHIALEHFHDCERTTIPAGKIEVEGTLVSFPIPGHSA